MKKIILLINLILTFNTVISQQSKDKNIKSIIKNGNKIFLFEKGKLKNIKSKNSDNLIFEYNQEGLVREVLSYRNGVKHSRKVYEYDKNGYIKKFSFFKKGKLKKEEYLSYQFNKEGFLITVTTKDFQLRKGVKFHYIRNFEMINDVLTFSNNLRMGKFKQKYKTVYTFENGNLKQLHNKIDDKNYNYLAEYNYDNKTNINLILMKSIFGNKYFTNSLITRLPLDMLNQQIVSKNNLIFEKIISKGKLLAITPYRKCKIEYNKESLPIKIQEITDDNVVTEFIIEYE